MPNLQLKRTLATLWIALLWTSGCEGGLAFVDHRAEPERVDVDGGDVMLDPHDNDGGAAVGDGGPVIKDPDDGGIKEPDDGGIKDIPDDGGDPPKEEEMEPSICEDMPWAVGQKDLRRLSNEEYANTIRDLFEVDTLEQLSPSLLDAMDLHPRDASGVRFDNMDVLISQQHVDSHFRVASAIGERIAQDAATRERILGPCALEPNISTQCLEGFLDGFAYRAHRHPVSPDTRGRYAALIDEGAGAEENWRLLVMATLLSPEFNYHFEEVGPSTDSSGAAPISAHDLANRLAYMFWHTMPDGELIDAAKDGSLLTEAGYIEQVDRLFEHPRTQATIASFYKQLYHLDAVPLLPQNDPIFNAMVTDGLERIVGPDRRKFTDAMRDEIFALTNYYTWTVDGSFKDLWTSERSFTDDANLAALYGVSPWDGAGEPPSMPAGERSGLLTRAAFLVTGLSETSPITRGVHVQRDYLCRPVPDPDPAALPEGALDLPTSDGTKTTRELVEAKTEVQPCVGCHLAFNGYGYVLESYDALGRWRTEELVYNEEGELLSMLDLDLRSTVHWLGASTDLSGPIQLSQFVGESDDAAQCFAKKYFSFAHGREPKQEDSCSVLELRDLLLRGTLKEALRATALSPTFKLRSTDN